MTTSPLPSREALAAALTLLANKEAYPKLKQEVTRLASTEHGGFLGELSPLNVLVEFARDRGADALAPLWKLTDRKHVQAFPDAKKNTYQASYMAQRRRRLYKAVELHENLTGRPMTGARRDQFKNALHTQWMAQRDELIEGKRPGNERNEIVRLFWTDIEEQLDQALTGDNHAARSVLGQLYPL